MVVQDSLTGALHEVPDGTGEVVYDGFGNPVGLFPFLANLFRGGAPSPSSLVANLLRQGGGGMVPGRQFAPPVGWTTPALPYTGRQPRRLYMRCAVWPGPSGLVPTHAAQMMPGMPGAPGFPGMPGMPGLPAAAAMAGRRRGRFRRRR